MDLPARASRAATRVGTYVFMIQYEQHEYEQREYRADSERSCWKGGRTRRTEPWAADHVRRQRGAPSGYRGNYTSRHCQRTRHTRPTDHRAPVTNHLLYLLADPPQAPTTVDHRTVPTFFPYQKSGNQSFGWRVLKGCVGAGGGISTIIRTLKNIGYHGPTSIRRRAGSNPKSVKQFCLDESTSLTRWPLVVGILRTNQ